MSAKRNGFLALFTATLFVLTGLLAANAQETGEAIDYPGFLELVETVEPIRERRLIDLDTFNAFAAEEGTLILDTRSEEAFASGHVDGAVNLPFSDFTDETLAKTIPAKTTRILIYCNNNFLNDVEPVLTKRAPLALNVPTFINLYGYGYQNLYELGDLVTLEDARLDWVSAL